MTDRGFANNNPGNIRLGQPWQGLSDVQTDPDFCQFIDPKWGIRAIAKIMRTYQNEGLLTLRQMINRWAPPSDNNPTDAYVANVAKICGVDPDAAFDLSELMTHLVCGIIMQENGSQPYTSDQIALGISLA